MGEISEQDKQSIIEFHAWVKAHPELQDVFHKQTQARMLMLRARFSTFHLPIATLSEIVKYGNEEFLAGYYLATTTTK